MRLPALACAALVAGCFPTTGDIRRGEPAMRASFPTSGEVTTDCLTRAWASVRLRWSAGPPRVDSSFVAGTGTIVVSLPQADDVAWLVEIARASGDTASATAWSRRAKALDSQAVFAEVMRQAVAACRGEVRDDRFQREMRRGIAHTDHGRPRPPGPGGASRPLG
jgi:hypothetical protein